MHVRIVVIVLSTTCESCVCAVLESHVMYCTSSCKCGIVDPYTYTCPNITASTWRRDRNREDHSHGLVTDMMMAHEPGRGEIDFDIPCKLRGTCDTMYLFVLCPPFSGSTALYSLLSTSENAVTLLEADTWAGEGQWLYFEEDEGKEQLRWREEDGNFNATKYAEVLMRHWSLANSNGTVMIEKSPPNMVRAHKLYNEFKTRGRVRFLMMLQHPCISRLQGKEYMKNIEYATVTLAQFRDITLYLTYDDLLLDTSAQLQRISRAFPEMGDIDPGKKPKGNYGERSKPLSEYIKSIDTIYGRKNGTEPYIIPKQNQIIVEKELEASMLRRLGFPIP